MSSLENVVAQPMTMVGGGLLWIMLGVKKEVVWLCYEARLVTVILAIECVSKMAHNTCVNAMRLSDETTKQHLLITSAKSQYKQQF